MKKILGLYNIDGVEIKFWQAVGHSNDPDNGLFFISHNNDEYFCTPNKTQAKNEYRNAVWDEIIKGNKWG